MSAAAKARDLCSALNAVRNAAPYSQRHDTHAVPARELARLNNLARDLERALQLETV